MLRCGVRGNPVTGKCPTWRCQGASVVGLLKYAALGIVLLVALGGCTLLDAIPFWQPHEVYSRGDLVRLPAHGGLINEAVYVSKRDGNEFHLPSLEPDWWMY